MLYPGDCIFVPGSYLHQVKSYENPNLAVTVLFGGPTLTDFQKWEVKWDSYPFKRSCETVNGSEPLSTLDIAWDYPGTGHFTMGFEDPDFYRKVFRGWAENNRGKLTRKLFRKRFKNEIIMETMQSGLDDRSISSGKTVAEMKEVAKKALKEAYLFYDENCDENGEMTVEQLMRIDRAVLLRGLHDALFLDYHFSLFDSAPTDEYVKDDL